MKIYIKKNAIYYSPILYVLKVIEKNRSIHFTVIDSADKAHIIWDDGNENSENISLNFYNYIAGNRSNLKHGNFFDSSLEIKDANGKEDIIATIFYMVNCLQEIEPSENELDHYGRFKYTASYQSKFENIQNNLVEQFIDRFCEKHKIIADKHESTFFISHDIDTIYGSLLQDGFWALKKMKIGVLLNLIAFELSRKPHWRNIDKIIKINSEYDIRSTFFWLVNNGKGLQDIKNSDYNITKEHDLLKLVDQSNNTNGLHKSCSTMTIDAELKKLDIKTSYNRYHFLNFLPHRDWKKISNSKLNFDCSLGFAEQYGFRNSYGKAFQPFDIDENKPYDFVEAPLNFMDGTFHKYMKVPTNEIGNKIINFYEDNSQNCDLSLLWHNTYFTNYKYNSFIDEYKKIITFIYESKIDCVSPKELVEKNKLEW